MTGCQPSGAHLSIHSFMHSLVHSFTHSPTQHLPCASLRDPVLQWVMELEPRPAVALVQDSAAEVARLGRQVICQVVWWLCGGVSGAEDPAGWGQGSLGLGVEGCSHSPCAPLGYCARQDSPRQCALSLPAEADVVGSRHSGADLTFLGLQSQTEGPQMG